eukprot:CAMPEP_0172318142 /NCGR_PEP_ID=MMETSP1058-20130122/33958_1 /TAXON_ID=83371 /ORGANISM="Detonula confervacea, Strain CCMP 353" /LENGTH=295 /DNA_ID=CAMNT_0013032887 /DNA_START=25 /DNA_END=909 /DNA_ORIENTATION=+
MDDSSFICGDHSFLSIIQANLPWEPNSSPYRMAFLTCHAVALLTFIVSSVTGNLSQVDKLWSLLPAIYAWMCVVDSRTTLMAGLTTLWSIRLTYNFYRRGGYAWPPWQGDEDYRWECIRRGNLGGWWTLLTNKRIMVLFNFVFISLFQNYLLLYIASPSFVAWSMAMRGVHCPSGEGGETLGVPPPLNIYDAIACFLFMAAFIVETMADSQQYNFQNKKREWKSSLESGGGFANAIKSISNNTFLKEYRDGFCQSGLFAIVRKPAYAGEQAIWISYYLFSVAASYSGDSRPEHYW